MRNNEWYENNKDIILDKYYNGKSILNICNEMSCNKSMIYRKFNEWDIERRKRISNPIRNNAKYFVDYSYFDNIDDEHKSYWLGFLLADGFVNDKEVSLCLQIKDIETIEAFKKDLKAEQPIYYNKDGNPVISIVCKRLATTLLNYGFHHRKSWELDISQILKHILPKYENHFIRGMFDGDGSVKYYQYPYFKKPQCHFGYTGLKNVCEYISSKLNIERKLVYEGNKTYSTITRNPEIIMNIYKYLYKNATIYLDRKYQTFKEIQMMTFNDYNRAIS